MLIERQVYLPTLFQIDDVSEFEEVEEMYLNMGLCCVNDFVGEVKPGMRFLVQFNNGDAIFHHLQDRTEELARLGVVFE